MCSSKIIFYWIICSSIRFSIRLFCVVHFVTINLVVIPNLVSDSIITSILFISYIRLSIDARQGYLHSINTNWCHFVGVVIVLMNSSFMTSNSYMVSLSIWSKLWFHYICIFITIWTLCNYMLTSINGFSSHILKNKLFIFLIWFEYLVKVFIKFIVYGWLKGFTSSF